MKADRAPINDGIPASESVAATALSGADYDPLASVHDDLSPVKVSVGYLHAVHPETGAEVVFVPGEALPEWAREVQKARYQPQAAHPKAKDMPKGQHSVRQQMTNQET